MDSYSLTVAINSFLTTSFILLLLIFTTKQETQDKFLDRLTQILWTHKKEIQYHALQGVEISPQRNAVEKFENSYKAATNRTYLITMRANAELADLILRNVPEAECLVNLADDPSEQHHITVVSTRARSRSF